MRFLSLAGPRPYSLVDDAAGRPTKLDQPRPGFASLLDRAVRRLEETPAAETDPKRLREAARDVEGVFLNLMCQEMLRTVGRGNGSFLPGGLAGDIYSGFLTQAYAAEMAKAGGIGLANLITSEFAE